MRAVLALALIAVFSVASCLKINPPNAVGAVAGVTVRVAGVVSEKVVKSGLIQAFKVLVLKS